MKRLFQTRAAALSVTVALLALPQVLPAQSWGDGMYHNGMQYMMWGGQLPALTAGGKAIVDSLSMTGNMDTAMSQRRYFVDSSGNGTRKYELFFGPYWYNPPSGAKRPLDGEQIVVRGGLYTGAIPPVLVVYQLNGQAWRDSAGAPPWVGRWVHRSAIDSTRVFCAGDSLTWASFPPGCMGTGMMGGGMMMWPDSMFMEFDEMTPDSLPFMNDGAAIMGFHLNAFAPTGISLMQGGMMGGQGMMTMTKSTLMRIYVHPDSLNHHGLNMGQMRMRFLDVDSTWKDVPNQVRDLQNNVLVFMQPVVEPFLAVTAGSATSVSDAPPPVPATFSLGQNYPNPFNPSTMIRYSIGAANQVSLKVYNILGEEVATLVDAWQPAGNYEVRFDGAKLPSGMYFYRLHSGTFLDTKRLTLLK